MSDLSRLLGDVYGASSGATPPDQEGDEATAETPVPAAPAPDDPPAPRAEEVLAGEDDAPGWADDRVLDEAFAGWVPGPPADASAHERDMLEQDEEAELSAPVHNLDEDDEGGPESLTELLRTEAWLFEGAEAAEEPARAPEAVLPAGDEVVPPEMWSRESDDLLPSGRRGRRRARRR